MLPGKILSSKLVLPAREVLMTKDGPPVPTHCNKNCCLCRRGIVSGLISLLLSVIFSAPQILFHQHIDNDKEFFIMTRNIFKGCTDFGLMFVNEISQWLEKNVAKSTGEKNIARKHTTTSLTSLGFLPWLHKSF